MATAKIKLHIYVCTVSFASSEIIEPKGKERVRDITSIVLLHPALPDREVKKHHGSS